MEVHGKFRDSESSRKPMIVKEILFKKAFMELKHFLEVYHKI